eukprot:403350847
MESNKTLYTEELKDLDKFETDIIDNGKNFIQEFFQKTKKRFVRIFDLQRKNSKDANLEILFSQLSELMDKEQFTFDKIKNRLVELQVVVTSYFSGNKKGSSLSKHVQSSNFCTYDLKTIRIIKLSRVYLDNLKLKVKAENSQQNSVLKNLPQNYNFWSPYNNKLSQYDPKKNLNLSQYKSSIRQNNQPQDFKCQKENKDQSFSNSLPSQFANLLQEVDDEIIDRIISQVELKLPTSILLSREETKSELQLVQQFGSCIKRVFWVFENQSYQKVRKSQVNARDPIFFTKQPNQDVQFGFKIFNHQVIDKLKIVDLKEVQVNFPHFDFVQIEGECFQHLSLGVNKQIENSYQNFLDFQKDQSTSFYVNNDVYRVDFSDDMQEMFEIIFISTNQGKLLKRFEVIQEPTISIKINNEIKWKVTTQNIDRTLKHYFENCSVIFSFAYNKMLSEKRNITLYFTICNQTPYQIHFEYKIKKPQGVIYSINPFREGYDIEMVNCFNFQGETYKYFNYITTFDRQSHSNKQYLSKPQQLSKSNFILTLSEKNSEYLYLSKLFFDSFYFGKVDSQQQPVISQEIPKIIKIEKIFNKALYERFVNEIKFMSQKYPGKDFEDIMQHLFHGTRDVDPSLIFDSLIGFDFRLSNDKCLFGRGAYFAKNSGYSDSYRHSIPNSIRQYQIFVALVITGESITFNQNQPDLKAPPYKPGSKTERYDSVHNGYLDHYIVYDHYRAYPGYLITYETI